MAEDNINQVPTDEPLTDKGTTFIALETVGRLSYGQELRLKPDDVIVALDGNPPSVISTNLMRPSILMLKCLLY